MTHRDTAANLFGYVAMAVALMLTAACSSTVHRAPVIDGGTRARPVVAQAVTPRVAERYTPVRERDWRPRVHEVVKGETMYGIAFHYGLDYHELAELNGIKDPSIISIGQHLQLFPGNAATPQAMASAERRITEPFVREQPKVVKYAYSDAALAQIEAVQGQVKWSAPAAKSEIPPVAQANDDTSSDDEEADKLQWSLPAAGTLIAQFSEAANRKGIDIAGQMGQSVMASAPGKVVYCGSGLRGYGKLIIIKHNKTYLSAYAHNDQLLVKEGQTIARGQKIAEMGQTDTDQVKLHFEVRRFGKPVDPAKYLPLGRS